MATWADWLTAWKAKKNAVRSQLGGRYNHPHRMTGVAFSGTLDYTIDERSFTANASPSNGDIAYIYTFDLDLTGSTGYTRIFETRQPWAAIPSGGPAQGEFVLAHDPGVQFWEFIMTQGASPAPEVIGTVSRDKYVYNSGTTTWDFDSTEGPDDISMEWYFSLDSGGDPISGGKDVENPDETGYLETFVSFSGTHSLKLAGILYGIVEKFPWTDPWPSETTAFNNNLIDFIDAANAADGAGHNGSCAASLDFP